MSILLDTDLLSLLERKRIPAKLAAWIAEQNDLVVSVTDMLRRTLGEHITLSTSLAREVWATRADPGQFQSAIVNMAVNARDAMAQGGKLVVETRNMVFDEQHIDFQFELQPGEYVQLSISDTGTPKPMDPPSVFDEYCATARPVGSMFLL